MGFADKYALGLYRCRWGVVSFWLGVFALGLIYGRLLFSQTHSSFDPPESTLAYHAQQMYQQSFPSPTTPMIVLVSTKDGSSVLGNFTKSVTESLKAVLPTFTPIGVYDSLSGYYTYNQYPSIANEFVSPSGDGTMILINYYGATSSNETDLITFVRNELTKSTYSHDNYDVGLTGQGVLFFDVQQATETDLVHSDSIVIPLALLVLAYVLRSLRLMIIPIISVFMSILGSFSLMYGFTLYSTIQVSSFAPSVMMSLVIAMSIDYSLFLLSRYKEEILGGQEKQEAVTEMLRHAGKIVIVSGLTLSVNFLGLGLFPMSFLASLGIASACAILVCLAVNLTLGPVLLMMGSEFFSEIGCSRNSCCCFKVSTPVASGYAAEVINNIEESHKEGGEDTLQDNYWFKTARLATTSKWAVAIIVVVTCSAIPIAVQLTNMNISIDSLQIFPRNTQSLDTWNQLTEEFPTGLIEPFSIIIPAKIPTDPKETATVLTKDFFTATNGLIRQLVSDGIVQPSGIVSPTYINGTEISVLIAEALLNEPTPTEYGVAYQYIWSSQVNHTNTSARITLSVDFDPLGDQATAWIRAARASMSTFDASEESLDYSFYLFGVNVIIQDSVDKIYELFPYEILITSLVVMAAVGLVFKSAFLPLRLAFTLALPLTFVYGLAVLFFEGGWVWNPISGLYWLTPVMSFSILVGLGLDYDVFLYSRIYEYRLEGYGERASITHGVYKTGGIITAAGIIMAIAFAGLLASSEMALNQFGFMLCVAVLVDTFIVRTLMVPAMMHLAGKRNWWPGYVPPVSAVKDSELEHNDLSGLLGGYPDANLGGQGDDLLDNDLLPRLSMRS